jgi:hypothetical protein
LYEVEINRAMQGHAKIVATTKKSKIVATTKKIPWLPGSNRGAHASGRGALVN